MQRATLEIRGMSCASCAAGIEKRLATLDGVEECSVNFATHRAAVGFDPKRSDTDRLVAAVEEVGYGASLPGEHDHGQGHDHGFDARLLVFSAALTLPLVLVAMVPALHFSGWEWLAFALATPVVLVGGLPFHRATLMQARHRRVARDSR